MKRIFNSILMGVLITGLLACSSISGRVIGITNKNVDYAGIYPGLRFSYDFFFDPDCIDKNIRKNITAGIRAPIAIIGIIDLPFSLAIDTILMPLDFIFWLTEPDEEEDG